MIISLCETNEIQDPGSRGFEIEQNGENINLFVVHKDGEFFGFINSCPHTGVNLDWQENQFLDLESTFIQCSTHDALFEISSGECISGPCIGDALSPVILTITNNTLFATLKKSQKRKL